jgi:outer membrane protein TolC
MVHLSLTGYANPLQDSFPERILNEKLFLSVLKAYHPVIKQADFDVKRATAGITASRGAFDPLLTTTSLRKRFASELYYDYYNPELVIPTWYGIEVYTGLENINGARVNRESTLGQTSYLGISIPLLKDLVLDKRRAMLQQAKIFTSQSKAERDQVINDLSFEALSAFWNWSREYQNLRVIGQAVKVNEDRLRLVKLEVIQGNRPAIDSIEAQTQLQQFQLLNSEIALRFLNAGLELSAYLWKPDGTPYLLPENVFPDSTNNKVEIGELLPELESFLQWARINHPKLRSIGYKMDWLAIEQKLKWQGLLPKLDIKANLLNKGYGVLSGYDKYLLDNNYKFGFDFRFPLRLSEARGEYRQAKYKLAQTGLEKDMTQLLIDNKIKSYFNETMNLRGQIGIQTLALDNYRKLLEGELMRFRIGESSLFLVNSREQKLLEAQQKLIELETKYYKSRAGILWATGKLL